MIEGRVIDYLQKELQTAVAAAGVDMSAHRIEVERAPAGQGDYMSSVALASKDIHGRNPKEFAEAVARAVESDAILKTEVAGRGFINFTLAPKAILAKLNSETLKKDVHTDAPKKINMEFISANPTGELHIGHGRGAFFGDVLGSVYAAAGHDVTREYYINDSRESTQIKELGKTARGEGGQYKTELVEKLNAGWSAGGVLQSISQWVSGKREAEPGFVLAKKIQEHNRNFIEKDLHISFDIWYSEEEKLRASGKSRAMLEELKHKSLAYEKEGAWWVKTSEYGDDQDRVIVRSDQTPSYFLADIAYHADKVARGYDILEDVWGADHQGHVKRMQAVRTMLGWKPQLLIHVAQLVSLKEGGEVKRMSKRAGTVVLLKDLVDELGLDVVRWFFAERALSTHMEFDVDLARQQNEKNPVFYVQYAHARACSILKKAKKNSEEGISSELLEDPSARTLALRIIQYPETINRIATTREVQRLPAYATDLATAFSAFYRDVRVIDEEGHVNEEALTLVFSTKEMLAQTLSLLGISAPEEM